MIYPKQFPSENNNEAEKSTYLALDKVDKNKYDIFFSRKFSAIEQNERTEYEADFIISDIDGGRINGILVVEVKGGIVQYDGQESVWTQNGRTLNPSPTKQASSILHSLMSRFDFLPSRVPMGWAVWFPDMINPGANQLPTELNESQLLDKNALAFPEDFLKSAFQTLYQQWPNKNGDRLETYLKFKEPLIRNLGYALPLHKKIEAAEIRFLELTQKQLELLRILSVNKNVLINGPAGSGKTVMATTIARELSEKENKVLLLTYNRVLANNIRYNLGKPENPQVNNYHSLAKRYIDQVDEAWWNETEKDQEFWELGVPVKLMDALSNHTSEFDYIIIDEAQDLRPEWFETLEKLIKPDGGYYIFLDPDQDIFNHSKDISLNRELFNFPLTENCRNTVHIIEQLKQYVKREIGYKADAVEGEPVRVIEYKSDTDQMNKIKEEWLRLVEEENVSPGQILLMMNANKKNSCLSDTKKFGKYKIAGLKGRTGQLDKRSVNYTSINIFKGLEADIVFIIDTDKVENPDMKVLYAQASRAKYLLYIFKI